jgi:hypothetical protein
MPPHRPGRRTRGGKPRSRSNRAAVPPRRRRQPARTGGAPGGGADAGSATVELVFGLPLLFALVLLLAQVAVWAHATHVAQATASRALAAARADGGTPASGRAAAEATLDQLGRSSLHDPRITIVRDPVRATVRVSGAAGSVVPFLHPPVHAEAAGPVETRREGIP